MSNVEDFVKLADATADAQRRAGLEQLLQLALEYCPEHGAAEVTRTIDGVGVLHVRIEKG